MQPACEKWILESVSNRTEALLLADKAAIIQGFECIVHGRGGEAVAREHLGRSEILAGFVNDCLEHNFLLPRKAIPNLGIRGILTSYQSDQRLVDTGGGQRATPASAQFLPNYIG